MYSNTGKVTAVKDKTTGELKAKYYYDETDIRIKKEGYDNNGNLVKTTYYVFGASLNAIYEDQHDGNGTKQTELPIYGGGRVGVAYKDASQNIARYSYELTDHLGNVRAVIEEQNGGVFVSYYADYYPFGWTMPERNGGSSYRYAYQGQEKDPETGWEAFELRMYDGRVGRWMTTDPYSEFHSPYLAMGNDPISLIDPDGGKVFADIYNQNGVLIGSDGNTDDTRQFYLATTSDQKLSVSEAAAYIAKHDEYGGSAGCGIKVVQIHLTKEEINTESTLLTIRTVEGHGTPTKYNSLYGGGTFDSYKDHPRTKVTKWGYTSSAAGAYQILESTWDRHSKALGLKDFSPKNQDKAAIAEIKLVKGAMDNIEKGNYTKALRSLSGKWTSLPGGSQQWKSNVDSVFLKNRATVIQQNL